MAHVPNGRTGSHAGAGLTSDSCDYHEHEPSALQNHPEVAQTDRPAGHADSGGGILSGTQALCSWGRCISRFHFLCRQTTLCGMRPSRSSMPTLGDVPGASLGRGRPRDVHRTPARRPKPGHRTSAGLWRGDVRRAFGGRLGDVH